ncbi:twin-arginine translocation signal domain-containing protein [Thermodesulfobacteriota bacterium]
MTFDPNTERGTTRRGFVKEISAGAAGIALAGMFTSAFMPTRESLAATPNPVDPDAPEGSKYRKCFLTELTPEERNIGFGASPMFVTFADNDIIEGCNYFSAMWMGESSTKTLGHGPHTHPVPEVLVAIGSDPEHPEDLGAEFELFMGEEMEKHIITKSTIIYIPENTIHCPFNINKVTRPFLFMQAHYGPKLAETARRDLVPEDMRNKYIFIDMDGSSEK